MWKFGLKTALAGGTIYYTIDQGVWRDSETTAQIYTNVQKEISPYVKEATKQIPVEFPELPSKDRIQYLGKYYWNCGVKTVFRFLIDLPTNSVKWTSQGFSALSSYMDTPPPASQPPDSQPPTSPVKK